MHVATTQEDFDFVMDLIHHPEIRPMMGENLFLGSFSPADYFNAEPLCLSLVFDGVGAVVLERYHDDTLECHTLFLPGHRGREAYNNLKKAAVWIFTQTPCEEIVTKTPLDNVRAQSMAKLIGFREICRDTKFVYLSLPITHWLTSGLVSIDDFVNGCIDGYGHMKAMVIYNRVARLLLSEPAKLVNGAIDIGDKRFNLVSEEVG